MSERDAVAELQAMDALAAEQGAVLAFRLAGEGDELEPVFMRVLAANSGQANETALVSIEDRSGLSLGRYLVARARLDRALAEADDVDSNAAEPEVVPADWSEPG